MDAPRRLGEPRLGGAGGVGGLGLPIPPGAESEDVV
jgi:hypothetical protein